jgi:Protein of unknown function (DUF3102)
MNNETCSEQAVALSGPIIEINRLHAEICQAARTTIEKAIRIGELLTEQKATLKHGEWLPWLKANVEFSRQTADNYRRVYEKREDIKLLNVGNLTDAYRLLASDKVELSALAQAHDPDGVMRQMAEIINNARSLAKYWPDFANELGTTLIEAEEELKRLEAIIENGFERFCQCAEAITEVRDKELYRGTYSSFAEYCQAEFGATNSRINELLSLFHQEAFAETESEL